jgi:hypothetical protein
VIRQRSRAVGGDEGRRLLRAQDPGKPGEQYAPGERGTLDKLDMGSPCVVQDAEIFQPTDCRKIRFP